VSKRKSKKKFVKAAKSVQNQIIIAVRYGDEPGKKNYLMFERSANLGEEEEKKNSASVARFSIHGVQS